MLTEYDAVMRECLQEILNLQLSDDQSSLPVKSAGLGIRRATDLALPAFLASAHGSNSGVLRLLDGLALDEEYSEVTAGEDLWKGLFEEDFDSPFPEDKTLQAEWDSILYNHIYNNFLSRETVPAERARLLAIASEKSSNWLNAIPVPDLELKLDDQSLRLTSSWLSHCSTTPMHLWPACRSTGKTWP